MKQYSIVLKIILLFSATFYVYYCINNYKYKENNIKEITGVVKNVKKNKIVVDKYIITTNKKIEVGDKILAKGKVSEPRKNTNFNLFNYRNYLLSKKINYIFVSDNIKIIKKSNSIKNRFINYVNSIGNSYLSTLILGDNQIDEKEYEKIKTNGISHLFAISGMHISLISFTLLFILNKISKRKKLNYSIVSIVLLFYASMTTLSASVIRSVLLFIFHGSKKALVLILFLMLIYNPFYIYDLGFLYTFVNSFFLLYFLPKNLLKTSIVAFLASFPITINSSNQINPLSIIYNLFFVPFITYIIFPLCFVVLLCPKLVFILNFFINLMSLINSFFYKFKIILIFKTLSPLLIIIYYLMVILYLRHKLKYLLYIYILLLYIRFNLYPVVTILDVNQGDSSLIELPFNKGNILIDTGGSKYTDINKYVITPYLKSRGIKRIDYLILTHGDFDHMGSSIELLKSYKVKNIIMNSYEDNELESKIKSKNIYHYSKNKLIIDNYTFYFLNTVNINENEDSLILYTELNNNKFLFMGDASIKNEEYLLNNYDLKTDFLKVGHHGSKSSSGKNFIDSINPKYALISVGRNNIYGHPNKEVLESLKNSNIYRTDIDGSIMINIRNNKLDIRTCLP